jgi:hypothetical protein
MLSCVCSITGHVVRLFGLWLWVCFLLTGMTQCVSCWAGSRGPIPTLQQVVGNQIGMVDNSGSRQLAGCVHVAVCAAK